VDILNTKTHLATKRTTFWTIRKTLLVGHAMITLPCSLIFFTPILLTYNEIRAETISWWIMFLAVMTGFALSWIYWGVMVTRWRLLAYRKVKNIKALKTKAIREFLIWPDHHWLILAEFRNEEERKKLRKADKLFESNEVQWQHSVVDASGKFPVITSHYHAPINILEITFLLLGVGIGTVVWYLGHLYVGLVFLIMSAIGAIYEYLQFTGRKQILEVNAKGIETQETGFLLWKNIEDAKVELLNRGRRTNPYLVIRFYPTHLRKEDKKLAVDHIELTEFDVDTMELKRVLSHYLKEQKKK
jgi:hypothetical protein